MKIIVGLGNPGKEYENTRHNIGFMATGALTEKYSITGKNESKFNAIVGKGSIKGKDVLIIQPLTYMNLSGEAISKILNWYKIDKSELLVIFDDMSFDLGRVRFRASGSDGGHNGIKSIIQHLGGDNKFDRLKVGIGPAPTGALWKNFVLNKFSDNEKPILNKTIELCIEAIEFYINNGLDASGNKFNGVKIEE